MATTSVKNKSLQVTVVKKMISYSEERAFKKKDERAIAFLKKNGLPEAFRKKDR